MSYVVHHAILVTARSTDVGREALRKIGHEAIRLGLPVSGPTLSPLNGVRTLTICPDGSNEGWQDSDTGDRSRSALIAMLNSDEVRYPDGSPALEWVEVRYSPDDGDASVMAHGFPARQIDTLESAWRWGCNQLTSALAALGEKEFLLGVWGRAVLNTAGRTCPGQTHAPFKAAVLDMKSHLESIGRSDVYTPIGEGISQRLPNGELMMLIARLNACTDKLRSALDVPIAQSNALVEQAMADVVAIEDAIERLRQHQPLSGDDMPAPQSTDAPGG